MQPDGAASLSEGVDYKKKYKTLKRKLRMLIYEQECFAEELRKAQRKLLRISRDKSFLLDRLLQYEQCDQSATDTDSTADSESDNEQPPTKRKKQVNTLGGVTEAPPPPSLLASMVTQRIPTPKSYTATLPSQSASQSPADSTTKSKTKVSKKTVKQGVKTVSVPQYQSAASSKPSPVLSVTSPTRLLARSLQGQGSVKLGQPAMSREELERHLDQKQSNKSAFMNIEKTPLLPENIFNENSNS